MFDNRSTKIIELCKAEILKEGAAYRFTDNITGKELVAKIIAEYDDAADDFLVAEFRKLARLSSEPEFVFVYFLASSRINQNVQSCYLMDYIPGDTLEGLLSAQNCISYDHAVDIVADLSSGLEKAHNFGVYHNDFHDNNIIVDKFGKAKIVDFLWYDFKQAEKNKYEKDLLDFKGIVKEIFDKCSDVDKQRFQYINDLCESASNLFGLSSKIKILSEITVDLIRLNGQGKYLISKLLNELPVDLSRSHCFSGINIEVPLICACINSTANYYDKRAIDIQDCLNNLFYKALQQLKSAEIIDWSLVVNNTGAKNKGPYFYNYRIDIRSKAIKWHLLLRQYYFLPPSFDEPFHEYIITQTQPDGSVDQGHDGAMKNSGE